jgi:hypothetical protein
MFKLLLFLIKPYNYYLDIVAKSLIFQFNKNYRSLTFQEKISANVRKKENQN